MRQPGNKYGLSLVISLLVCIAIGIACKNEKPEPPPNLIPEETYIKLIAEFQIIEAYLQKSFDTTAAVQKTQFVLDHYDVTMEQFKSSTKYYEYDVDAQYQRIQEATDLLSRSIK